ncbi:MAG: DUF72 domain-containing protein [Gemmatimonadaceae bacterium]|nr:DUF72 domain-containing protein [Gemmatimonadaceae bacterium]
MNAQPPAASDGARARIGCAGWALRPEHAGHFPAAGTHLQRYATIFNAVEINSSFHRTHRRATYEKWASSVPDDFRFAVKLPKEITHVSRLVDAGDLLERFADEISGLGKKLGPILVQLPPKFEYNAGLSRDFIAGFRERFSGDIVWEPRHATWFTRGVETLFSEHRIARVAADPARVPEAAVPAGSAATVYYRLHGSPRIYYSKYTSEFVGGLAERIRAATETGSEAWCIFDNSALGAATEDALALNLLLQQPGREHVR